jgi:hypothetical protein
MKENFNLLLDASKNALLEIKSNAVPFLSIEKVTSWIDQYKELEEETILFDFIAEDTNDFRTVFYLLERITKLTTTKNEIIKCSTDFKKINPKKYDEVLNFLNTYQEILSKYSLPDFIEVDEKYYALSKFDYLKFKKEDLQILIDVNEDITLYYRPFYLLKLNRNDSAFLKILEEIIEITQKYGKHRSNKMPHVWFY